MSDNLITSFDNFKKKENSRVTKSEIKNRVIECLSNSKFKMNVSEISKITRHKPDKIYVALNEIEAKAKVINDVSYWYIKENQIDPISKAVIKKSGVDKTFLELNNGKGRKVFLTMEDYLLSKNESTSKKR